MKKQALQIGLMFGMMAAVAFAQMPGEATAQGIASGFVGIARWIGVILCIICGFGIAAGGPGAVAKVSGLVLGLVFAFFANPIVNFISSLG